ncbi:hypothetical protein CcCBS67573_g05007 [Chytriomyces confervae]|uniref:Uncharacterized protein n=1 Tax=Chytriomyces confervae TaxID=246404 RepID=A0A507FEK8_9FUNG|nr:hypothetical protein CcCBS67573_g05007 [Chytriomyces confervae]
MPLEYSLWIKELKVLLARNGYPSAQNRATVEWEWALRFVQGLTLEHLEVYNDRFQWNAAEDGTPWAPCTSLDMQRKGTAHAAVPSIDSNRKVFAFCLSYGLDEATFKCALDHFGPQAEVHLGEGKSKGLVWIMFQTTEGAAKAIACKNLAFPSAGKPDVIVGFVKAETRRSEGTANVGTGEAVAEFVFHPINAAAFLYSLDPPTTTSTVMVDLDSAATGSLGHYPVFAQITQNPTIYRGIDGGCIISSRMEGTISGTTHMTDTIYTTPPIEHIPDAKHNLLSVHDILAKQQMSVLFDHTNMTSNIGHLQENGPWTTMAKGISDKDMILLASSPHRRTHIGDTALERSMKLGTTDGLDFDLLDKSKPCTCESCIIAKMHQIPHPWSEGAKYAPQNLLGVVTADVIVFLTQ